MQGDIPRSLWDNFKHYGLPLPELVRMDLHLWDQHVRAGTGGVAANMFDAIVTDPPVRVKGLCEEPRVVHMCNSHVLFLMCNSLFVNPITAHVILSGQSIHHSFLNKFL